MPYIKKYNGVKYSVIRALSKNVSMLSTCSCDIHKHYTVSNKNQINKHIYTISFSIH